jgi:hypothetical protein
MGMDYIRRTYGVPAKRGGRIQYDGGHPDEGPKCGTITSATNSGHIRVRFDGERRTYKLHPTWAVAYMKPPNQKIGGACVRRIDS